jgi:hypothetical protein
MYPQLTWEAKFWARVNEQRRQALVRGLREAVASVRAEKGR